MITFKKVYEVPYVDNCYIDSNGNIYTVNNDGVVQDIPVKMKKHLFTKINGLKYRVDGLMMQTFYGIKEIDVIHKDDNEKNCEIRNLKPIIHSIEKLNDDYICINNIPILFKKYRHYYVSKDGVVLDSTTNQLMIHSIAPNGYHWIGSETLHRIVYETWVKIIDEGMVIYHIDDHKWHNSVNNLEEVTFGENNRRAFKTGLKKYKWSDDEVHVMCRMMERGCTLDDICVALGIADDAKERRLMSVFINHLKNSENRADIVSQYDLSKYDNSKYRYKVLTDRDEFIIRELMKRNYGPAEMSRIMGIKDKTIATYVAKVRQNNLLA